MPVSDMSVLDQSATARGVRSGDCYKRIDGSVWFMIGEEIVPTSTPHCKFYSIDLMSGLTTCRWAGVTRGTDSMGRLLPGLLLHLTNNQPEQWCMVRLAE